MQVVVNNGVLAPGRNFLQSKDLKLKSFSDEVFRNFVGPISLARNF